MKIYTRTGDSGQTGLAGGTRVSKDVARLEVCGTIDELNAVLGLVRSEPLDEQIDQVLERIQHELFELGAQLAAPDRAAQKPPPFGPLHVQAVEDQIDRCEQSLQPLKVFLVPAGSRAAAGLHVARAVCRRAERRLVTLIRQSDEEKSATAPLAYLNRLSDLLFVLARTANVKAGREEIPWRKPSQSPGTGDGPSSPPSGAARGG